MKKQKIKKNNHSFLIRPFLMLFRVLKFLLIIALHFIAPSSKKKDEHLPTLQEQVMGENIPFSDRYYIPDDKFHK